MSEKLCGDLCDFLSMLTKMSSGGFLIVRGGCSHCTVTGRTDQAALAPLRPNTGVTEGIPISAGQINQSQPQYET